MTSFVVSDGGTWRSLSFYRDFRTCPCSASSACFSAVRGSLCCSDTVGGSQLQELQHQCDDVWVRDGLAGFDGQRRICVCMLLFRWHKPLPRDCPHGIQDSGIMDAPFHELLMDPPLPQNNHLIHLQGLPVELLCPLPLAIGLELRQALEKGRLDPQVDLILRNVLQPVCRDELSLLQPASAGDHEVCSAVGLCVGDHAFHRSQLLPI